MEMKRMLYVTGLLLCTSLGGYAQEGNLIDVKVVNEEVKKQGSEVSLRMTLDLTGLRVGNQKSVCLHPAVVSADGTHEAVLAPVVVDGKTRSRVHRREKALTGASPATDNAYTVLRSGRESRVEYIAKLAYEPWMVDSRLVLRERMTGCLDCTAATEESTVKAPFIKLFTPRYVTPFVTPEREAVKVRNEVRVARLQFRQGKSDVDPRYKDNRAELETVTGSINVVKTNPDLTITGIYITGYASPEGSVAFNQKLSESRANALAEYARKDTHMDASLWHVAGMGEDWEGLRREVEKHPQLLDIDKVLRLSTSSILSPIYSLPYTSLYYTLHTHPPYPSSFLPSPSPPHSTPISTLYLINPIYSVPAPPSPSSFPIISILPHHPYRFYIHSFTILHILLSSPTHPPTTPPPSYLILSFTSHPPHSLSFYLFLHPLIFLQPSCIPLPSLISFILYLHHSLPSPPSPIPFLYSPLSFLSSFPPPPILLILLTYSSNTSLPPSHHPSTIKQHHPEPNRS